MHKSKTQAYKQAGNSVSVPVIEAIAKQIKKRLHRLKKNSIVTLLKRN
ncbi:cytosine-specific methyltransferase [Klebsiella phage CPRSB]|nr:cytosine-specific methyltransferase [Klebsiella phage CPRSB]